MRQNIIHKIGVDIAGAMTALDALKKSGSEWDVKKVPIQTETGIKIPNKFAIVREDNNAPLGVVGNVFRPFQNKSAFSLFDETVKDKIVTLERAGCLGQGQMTWVLAKIPGKVVIAKDDEVEKYILLVNRHDGKASFKVAFTPHRIVCSNAINIAMDKATSIHSIRHSIGMNAKIEDVKQHILALNKMYEDFGESAKWLVQKQVNKITVDKFLNSIGFEEKEEKKDNDKEDARQQIVQLFESGKGNSTKEVKGSAWALFNGLVEYVDFFRGTRKTEDVNVSNNQRAKSMLFGSGQKLKQKAWNFVSSL